MNLLLYITIVALFIFVAILFIDRNSSHNKDYSYNTKYDKPVKNIVSDTFDIITTVDGIDNRAIRIYLPIYIKVQKLDKLSKEQKSLIKNCDNIQEFLKEIIFGETRAILISYFCDEMVSNVSVERKYREEIRQNIMTEFNRVGYTVNRLDFGKLTDDAGYLDRLR